VAGAEAEDGRESEAEGVPLTQADDSKHQDQVKELIQKTADSLDNLALKMLFVSVQQNNLELCIRSAIKLQVQLLLSSF